MTWRDVLFGLEQELLDPSAPVDFAVEQLAKAKEPVPELVELAGLDKQEQSRGLVESLASREQGGSTEETQRKWLYLVLAWLLEHREELPDPLRAVEEVYADFGYPAEIASFVRYMPSNAPDLGSREQNEARLFARWLVYLEERQAAFALRDRGHPSRVG
jgi:hypothetical protein